MALNDAEVRKEYDCGKSCAAVAELDGCSETSMYNRMMGLGVVMRSRSEANQLFPNSVFILLYNLGLSTSQIGKLLGVDSSTVTKRLHLLKFPLRSRRVASRIRYTEKEFNKYFMVPNILDQLTQLVCATV